MSTSNSVSEKVLTGKQKDVLHLFENALENIPATILHLHMDGRRIIGEGDIEEIIE